MAIRGAKPKPAFLKVVTGNPGHRPIKEDAGLEVDRNFDNHLEPPKKLKKRQQELWDTYIRKAPWLSQFDVPRAFMWVEIHAEFEKDPGGMIAGMIAQLRSLGSELGLDPASRSRIGTELGKRGNKDPAEKYFT